MRRLALFVYDGSALLAGYSHCFPKDVKFFSNTSAPFLSIAINGFAFPFSPPSMKSSHASPRLAPSSSLRAAQGAYPALRNQAPNDTASQEPPLGSRSSTPSKVVHERALEEKHMNQPPPQLREDVIRSTRVHFDEAGDFVIEFENHKNAYALVVLLHNRRRLKWRESRAIRD
eukprot:IDg14552t1